ncbi:hypothetical protein KM043_001321 [Ampulex compressa]|nr:hypothetical protein KM043_001321 [Ampulex compressa]
MFALSDDETFSSISKTNPIEEHLREQLSDVQNRIKRVDNNIEEIQGETQLILKALHSRVIHGRDTSSDSDSDLYTLDGCPLIKKKRHKANRHPQILVVRNKWQRIVCDKWVLGVTLQNTSNQ